MPRSKHKDPQNPKTHKDPKTLKNKRQHYKKEKEKEKEKKPFFLCTCSSHISSSPQCSGKSQKKIEDTHRG